MSGLSHTDRFSSVIRCLIYYIYGKNKSNVFRFINWFVLTDILLANGYGPNLILPKFVQLALFTFVSSSFWHLQKYILLDENSL